MTSVTNPLADLANQLGMVRVIWGIIGTVFATLGFTIPFVSPDLFTLSAFDQIVEFIVGTAGAAFALYQAYGRRVEVPQGLSTQSLEDRAKATTVGFSPFGNVTV